MATITSDDATILRPYYRMKFSEGTTGIHQHANRCSKFQRALVDRHLVAAFTTESQNSEQLFTCAENKPDRLWTIRRNTTTWCRSAAFSASSRLFDLNGETKTLRTKHSSAIIVRRR